jgi:tetratricopeptide (TPR) repeat protein
MAVPPQRGDGSARRGWILALTGLLLVALAAGAAALLASGGDSSGEQRADSPARTSEQTRTQQTQQTQPQESPAAPQEQTPPAAAPDNEPETGAGPDSETGESPAALNDAGYALLQDGEAGQAIPLLERAVRGYEAQGNAADPTAYGYALYNLGSAYAAAGRPADAIPLFEKRLQVSPNDRPGVVKKAIRDAQKAAGDKPGKGNGGAQSEGARYDGDRDDERDDE